MLNNSSEIQFDGPPPISLVQQAIHSLYHDQNKNNRDSANNWLNKLQNTLYAWKIADELLINKVDVESCYFGAQTLRTKIQSHFNELPSESYISLKDSILNHLKTIDSSQVQTQLALSITYLIILAPSWQNPIEELISKNLDKAILVEIFIYLLEEFDQSRQKYLKGVGSNRRHQFSQYLSRIAPQIINFLNNTVQEAILVKQTEQSINDIDGSPSVMTEKLFTKIYRCLGVWINSIEPNEMNLIEPLLANIFESLRDPDLCDIVHDTASDTVCGAALLCENYTKYQQLTHYLLNQICQLEDVYQHSVSNEDLDKSVNYSRIFTEMGESIVGTFIIDAIIESNSFNVPGIKIINLLLQCIAHYDYEVAEITFHFWFRFTELINKKGSQYFPLFTSISNKLILGLTRHCQLESDQEGLLEIRSCLYEFRERANDLIKEVISIVGPGNYIENNIIGCLKKSLLDLSNKDPNITWEEVEAQLFIISCIISDVTNNDNLFLTIIDLIMNTQGKDLHIQIFATCCKILGEMYLWLQKNNTYLNPILNFLISIITVNPQPSKENSVTLASIASLALQKIVVKNSFNILMNNSNLINILIQICNQLDPISNETATESLLRSCSTIISIGVEINNLETIQNKEDLIVRLLKPSVDSLNSIVCNNLLDENIKTNIIIYLNRITTVFKNLKFEHAFSEISLISQLCTQQIWPIIENLLNQTINLKQDPLVEKCCRCLRSIIRFLKPSWLLKPIATSIVCLYQINPTYSTYLYLVSILVDEFGATQDYEISGGLIKILNTLCVTTFQLLTVPNLDLKNYPDTIEDFFRLCTRYLQRSPEIFLTESMLETILNLNVMCISLDHRDANNSVNQFLYEFLTKKKTNSTPICEDIVRKMLIDKNYGQQFLDAIVMAALVKLPPHYLPDMSDLIWKMLNWDNKQMEKWLEVTIRSIPTKNNLGGTSIEPSHLEEFYNNILRANNPKAIASSLRFISQYLR